MSKQSNILSKTFFKRNDAVETLIISTFLFGILPTISFGCNAISSIELMPIWMEEFGMFLKMIKATALFPNSDC